MKTFNELDFSAHKMMPNTMQARIYFDNGYGLSVIKGEHTYGGTIGLYEAGILEGERLTYDTGIFDDVEGYLTEDNVTEIMRQVQELETITADA